MIFWTPSVTAELKRPDNIVQPQETGVIDLYWVHRSDNVTSMEEILRGLDDLVRSGKILYAGIALTYPGNIAK